MLGLIKNSQGQKTFFIVGVTFFSLFFVSPFWGAEKKQTQENFSIIKYFCSDNQTQCLYQLRLQKKLPLKKLRYIALGFASSERRFFEPHVLLSFFAPKENKPYAQAEMHQKEDIQCKLSKHLPPNCFELYLTNEVMLEGQSV